MTTGYSFRPGDMGTAECKKCGGVFFHVYGKSDWSHLCPQAGCGGILRCGMDACEDRVEIALQLEIMDQGMVRYRDMLISLAKPDKPAAIWRNMFGLTAI